MLVIEPARKIKKHLLGIGPAIEKNRIAKNAVSSSSFR
jgi:hypothetical protein